MDIKKIIKEEIDDFDWIRSSEGVPIDEKNVDDIILDYFKNKPTMEYEGWKYFMDNFSGVVNWKNNYDTNVYFATPYWGGEVNVPIDYQDEDGDYDNVENLPIPDFKIKEELIDWLDHDYPKIVHQSILKHISSN